jgi:hypothetical protein
MMRPLPWIVSALLLMLPAAIVMAAESGQARLVRILRFDCVKAGEEAGAAAEFPWSKGIGLWTSGGPGGAAWNARSLRCAVEFETGCTQGRADAELRIGGAVSATMTAPIRDAGAQRLVFDLTADRWEKHLDQASPSTKRFPYRTATFSALVMASCEAPETFGPGLGPRLEFADDSHFTAGFAQGE